MGDSSSNRTLRCDSMGRLHMSIVHAVAVTAAVTGWVLFFWKCVTVDALSSLGKSVDGWHDVVSRWLPIPNDLFASLMLVAGVVGLFLVELTNP